MAQRERARPAAIGEVEHGLEIGAQVAELRLEPEAEGAEGAGGLGLDGERGGPDAGRLRHRAQQAGGPERGEARVAQRAAGHQQGEAAVGEAPALLHGARGGEARCRPSPPRAAQRDAALGERGVSTAFSNASPATWTPAALQLQRGVEGAGRAGGGQRGGREGKRVEVEAAELQFRRQRRAAGEAQREGAGDGGVVDVAGDGIERDQARLVDQMAGDVGLAQHAARQHGGGVEAGNEPGEGGARRQRGGGDVAVEAEQGGRRAGARAGRSGRRRGWRPRRAGWRAARAARRRRRRGRSRRGCCARRRRRTAPPRPRDRCRWRSPGSASASPRRSRAVHQASRSRRLAVSARSRRVAGLTRKATAPRMGSTAELAVEFVGDGRGRRPRWSRPRRRTVQGGAGRSWDRSVPRPADAAGEGALARHPAAGQRRPDPLGVEREGEAGGAVAAGARELGREAPAAAGQGEAAGGVVGAGAVGGGEHGLAEAGGDGADGDGAALEARREGGEPGGGRKTRASGEGGQGSSDRRAGPPPAPRCGRRAGRAG